MKHFYKSFYGSIFTPFLLLSFSWLSLFFSKELVCISFYYVVFNILVIKYQLQLKKDNMRMRCKKIFKLNFKFKKNLGKN